MLSVEDVKERFKEVGVLKQFGTKKEVAELPNHIDDENGEIIVYACSAMLDGNTWLMVCTNKKLLFLDKGMVYGFEKVEMPLSKINSINYKTGLVLGEISIHHGSAYMNLECIDKKALKPMVDSINNVLKDYNIDKPVSNSSISNFNIDKVVQQNNEIIMLLSSILQELKKEN